uniref:Hypothetical secreted peptide n=1 Tax=Glossina morsitans morsitans TaxID=37546 RepID=D3TSG2_GLOMM
MSYLLHIVYIVCRINVQVGIPLSNYTIKTKTDIFTYFSYIYIYISCFDLFVICRFN